MESKLLLSVILVIFLIGINTARDYSDYGQQHAREFQLGPNPMFIPDVKLPDYDQGMSATNVMGYASQEKKTNDQATPTNDQVCDAEKMKGFGGPYIGGNELSKHKFCYFHCVGKQKGKDGHCNLKKDICVCTTASTQTDQKCEMSKAVAVETSPQDQKKDLFCEEICLKKDFKYGYCNGKVDKCACSN